MRQLVVVRCLSESHALANVVYVHPKDLPSTPFLVINRDFYYAVKGDSGIDEGHIATSTTMRSYMALALGERVAVEPFDPLATTPNCYIDTVVCGVSLLKKGSARNEYQFDAAKMADIFRSLFSGQVLSVGQPLVMENAGIFFKLSVHDIRTVNLEVLGADKDRGRDTKFTGKGEENRWGIVMSHSGIVFVEDEDANGQIAIINSTSNPSGIATSHPIVQPNFRFEDMGIGGLADEFGIIFRRAFASRIFPPALVKKLGIQHVKGLLLHGPPGTGKTLIARQIGKMLNAKDPKIVNGPEILNKYVGQSEENIRALFKDAEAEFKAKGDSSQLHIIIFDELDAICRQRGSRGDSTGVGDQIVNQLLTKMDGVEQLNNILVIGMTNRLDLIDEALLRPGRMEVHLEIGLPNQEGRLEIFKIHTAEMRLNSLLSPDVDLKELAALTKNFSGAEITGLIKSAASFAFNRHVSVGKDGAVMGEVGGTEGFEVTREDFINALRDVQPSFGRSDAELSAYCSMGIIEFSDNILKIIADSQSLINEVRNSNNTQAFDCFLLYGPSGTGKTALAAHLAIESGYPFVKAISAKAMIGMGEGQRVQLIQKIFTDAYRSPLSMIIIDGIEQLLDFVPIGPRFLNSVLQALIVLMTNPPPSNRRLLIIATTSNQLLLHEMGMQKCFTEEIYVPPIQTAAELTRVIEKTAGDRAADLVDLLRNDQGFASPSTLCVPIKRALRIIGIAVQDSENYLDIFRRLLEPYIVLDAAPSAPY